MKIQTLSVIWAFTALLIAQDVSATPPLVPGQAASAPTARTAAPSPAGTASTWLAAAEAARRDNDPQVNGAVSDRLPATRDLAKR